MNKILNPKLFDDGEQEKVALEEFEKMRIILED